ncbi:MAG: alpha/beta hydrolase fold protein [Solirubrobacterales bacterium]|nr:alpha/beta hydrolase fold protein [Solirubrobacterales bacterium]
MMSTLTEIELHGHTVCFRESGEGPLVVLVHGITGRSEQWGPAIEHLAAEHRVLAPDLLGHGESAKPRGDYSLGAYASAVRDTMVALGHERATIVGHSLGGGIAMQFAYQFPERCERLVLVSSGGLGREVHLMLRAATLPGSELVLPLLTHAVLLARGEALGRALGRLGLQAGTDMAEIARGFASLGDSEARAAFIHTMRAVLEPGGQRVSALDRLYLAEALPTLIVWGACDPIIPVEHGRAAQKLMPHSRLEILDGVGHFPQLERPFEFARLLAEFVADTEAAELDTASIRDRLLAGVA